MPASTGNKNEGRARCTSCQPQRLGDSGLLPNGQLYSRNDTWLFKYLPQSDLFHELVSRRLYHAASFLPVETQVKCHRRPRIERHVDQTLDRVVAVYFPEVSYFISYEPFDAGIFFMITSPLNSTGSLLYLLIWIYGLVETNKCLQSTLWRPQSWMLQPSQKILMFGHLVRFRRVENFLAHPCQHYSSYIVGHLLSIYVAWYIAVNIRSRLWTKFIGILISCKSWFLTIPTKGLVYFTL